MPALREKYLEVLAEEGYRPKLNEVGDVVLKIDGAPHIVEFDEKDPCYVRILRIGFWPIEDAAELERAYIATSMVNHRLKGAKLAVVDQQSVWASVEFLVGSLAAVEAPTLLRQLNWFGGAIDEFRSTMLSLIEEAPDESEDPIRH